jgi:hypothetical protein
VASVQAQSRTGVCVPKTLSALMTDRITQADGMIGLLRFVLGILTSPFKSKSRLEAENAVLRHQLIVLRRKMRGRPRLTNNDRWFFIQLYRWIPSILKVLTNHPTRDAGALAQGRLSLLLALEVAPTRRATADRDGAARVDPADERRKSALGRATGIDIDALIALRKHVDSWLPQEKFTGGLARAGLPKNFSSARA